MPALAANITQAIISCIPPAINCGSGIANTVATGLQLGPNIIKLIDFIFNAIVKCGLHLGRDTGVGVGVGVGGGGSSNGVA